MKTINKGKKMKFKLIKENNWCAFCVVFGSSCPNCGGY